MLILYIWKHRSAYKQCSKWAGICQYNKPELLFVPEFHTGTYKYILYPFIFSIFVTIYPCFAFSKYTGSGSIVSDYGLDDRAMGVRSPAGAKDFSSLLCVQTGSGAHPASCPIGTGGPFPGVKRGRGVMLTTHPHLVPRSWMSMSYTSSPPKRLHGV
jgi:hypothetical protein